jgi:hypothetical protein
MAIVMTVNLANTCCTADVMGQDVPEEPVTMEASPSAPG